jgi:hypothetical protein
MVVDEGFAKREQTNLICAFLNYLLADYLLIPDLDLKGIEFVHDSSLLILYKSRSRTKFCVLNCFDLSAGWLMVIVKDESNDLLLAKSTSARCYR